MSQRERPRSLYETTVVLDRESTVPAPEPVASSSGARYLALAIVVTIISLLHCNVLSLACSIPGIIYASKARSAAGEGDKRGANVNKKTSFAFTLIAIIGWIVVICTAGFVAYTELCGFSGIRCDTRIP